MNIFISWSGGRSQKAAEAFEIFFRNLFRHLHPHIYVSTKMDKGTRWDDTLYAELIQADLGLLILTRENCANPSIWMMYEAGVLSRTTEKDCTMTFLLDAGSGRIPGPVSRIQSTSCRREEIVSMAVQMYRLYIRQAGTAVSQSYTVGEMEEYANELCVSLMEKLNLAAATVCGDDEKPPEDILLERTGQLLAAANVNQTLLQEILTAQSLNGAAERERTSPQP